MGDPQEADFRDEIRARLSQIEEKLVDVMRKLIAYQYPPEVHAIDFEIFTDSFTSQFPARAFFLDKSNTEYFIYVNGKAAYPSPVDPDLLEIEHIYSEELEEAFTTANPDADPWYIASSEFLPWFVTCWAKAGGAKFSLHASIAPHDSSWEVDLATGKERTRYGVINP
ncbi:MAG TPA: hypothetical protein VJA19_05785 [Pseudomonas sp.]|nr:hypothetical protein [Pseudomonas sp.]